MPFVLLRAASGSEPRLFSSARAICGDIGEMLPALKGFIEGLNDTRGLCGEPGALFVTYSSVPGVSSEGLNRCFDAGEFGVLLVRTTACLILLICKVDADKLSVFPAE